MRHAEYMIWPRGMAIAECVWSPPGRKSWTNFYQKVEEHFKRFDVARIKYAPSMYDPIIAPFTGAENSLMVQLTSEIPGLDLYYTFDNSFPDQFYPKYTLPVAVPKDASMLRVISYRDGKPVGRMITVQISDLKARLRKK